MKEDIEQKLYDAEITAVVHGFIQVWNKFESTLSTELTRIQESLEGLRPGKESHPNANYELFYRVSSNIYLKDSVTMGELSKSLSVPLSTATRMVDWLVDNGYLERLPDAEDRRVVRVTLTNLGQEIHKTIDRYIRHRVQQIFSCLTNEERTTLLTLIGKVIYSLKEVTR
ncbi:MAG: MarR family transcriptional regulator [Chloroflexi bacterium]|nr:MarR family transcriptional regulator [Chloroflexota bacterium]